MLLGGYVTRGYAPPGLTAGLGHVCLSGKRLFLVSTCKTISKAAHPLRTMGCATRLTCKNYMRAATILLYIGREIIYGRKNKFCKSEIYNWRVKRHTQGCKRSYTWV
jgi:hypothetical protein